MRSRFLVVVSLAVACCLAASSGPAAGDSNGLTLTILHSNDASSALLNPGEGLEAFGGIARFKSLVDRERAAAGSGPNEATIVLSAGNGIEVGPTLAASLAEQDLAYEAIAMRAIGYDAAGLGDQDFGLGPDVLAALLCGTVRTGGGSDLAECGVSGRMAFPFLSANLNFEGEPGLQAFVEAGGLAGSTIATKGAHRIGIVGVTTPDLPVISSPRFVTLSTSAVRAVQAEVDALQALGVNKIILLAQLGGVDAETAFAAQISGVDVIVSGGAGTLLANPGDLLVPGDRREPGMTYPLYAADRRGASVPIVTTAGRYKYLGKLVVEFDSKGNLAGIDSDSGPIRVAAADHEGGIRADRILTSAIDRPVQAFRDALADDVIATTQVQLDGRTEVIRTQETNLGNLMADAALWQARELAAGFGVEAPTAAILNAGGMRFERLGNAGPVSHLDTYAIAPFASFISVVEDVTPEQLKRVMENALSWLPDAEGRFGQIAGFRVTYDPSRHADDLRQRRQRHVRRLTRRLDSAGQRHVHRPGRRRRGGRAERQHGDDRLSGPRR